MIEIELVPHKIFGRYVATVRGLAIIKPTRQPFFNAARALLQLGNDPEMILQARHQGSSTIAMRSTIGEAAKWAIKELDRGGLRKVPWEAAPRRPSSARTGDGHSDEGWADS